MTPLVRNETAFGRSNASLLPKFARTTSVSENEPVSRSQLRLTLVDPLASRDWDCMIASHPEANFFHTSAWAKVLRNSYGHTPIYLHVSRRGSMIALVPLMEIRSAFTGRRGICLPFSDFCVPLIFDKAQSVFVIEELAGFARLRGWKYFEIRGKAIFSETPTPSVKFYGHQLDLCRDLKTLFDTFSSSARRAIRKAEKSNLTVEVTRSLDALSKFYQLHIRTRRRQGLPPQPFSFFQNIHSEILERNLGLIVVANSGSHPAAAAIFFHFGESAIYKFGASNEALQKLRANNLVMWEAIKFLVQAGCKTLHLGRTSLDNEGLRRFKLLWGTTEGTIDYFKFNTSTGGYGAKRDHTSGFHNKVFRKLPLALNRLAGAAIYPHLD